MYSLHTKKRLSDLLVLSALLLFISLEVVGCRDMEDCRSLYDTNLAHIIFKGNNSLTIDHADVELPTGQVEKLENTFSSDDDRKFIKNALKNLKEQRLAVHLSAQHHTTKLLLYKTATDTQPHTITFHYNQTHSLLSPSCGIQPVYVIERVETSFESSTILAPEGKVANFQETNKPHVEISY